MAQVSNQTPLNTNGTVNQSEIDQYVKECTKWLENYTWQAACYRTFNATTQMIISLGAALTAFTVIYPNVPKIIPAIISSLVVLSTGIANYFHFDRASMGYQKTADLMTDELNYYQAGVGNYKDLTPRDALEKFMVAINAAKNGRLTNWDVLSNATPTNTTPST